MFMAWWEPCRLQDCPLLSLWGTIKHVLLILWAMFLKFHRHLDSYNCIPFLLGSQRSMGRYLGVGVFVALFPALRTYFLLRCCITSWRYFQSLYRGSSGESCALYFIPSFRQSSSTLNSYHRQIGTKFAFVH